MAPTGLTGLQNSAIAPTTSSATTSRGGGLLQRTPGRRWKRRWLSRLFARQLLAYEPGPDLSSGTPPEPDLAREVPTQENGGISADGLTDIFDLRPGVRWSESPAARRLRADFARVRAAR